MSRRSSAFFAFTWPVIFFLTVLGAAVLFAGPACGGDDLADLTARLEAQTAAARPHADPFAAKNAAYTHRYESDYGGRYVCDCGCIETGQCVCKNCCSPVKTRRADERPAAKGGTNPPGCKCPEGGCNCWVGEDCGADCAFGGKKPKEGATRPATDGGADWKWTNAEGGYYWRYATPQRSLGIPRDRPAYYAPPRQAFFAPAFGGGCAGGS